MQNGVCIIIGHKKTKITQLRSIIHNSCHETSTETPVLEGNVNASCHELLHLAQSMNFREVAGG